MDQFWRQVDIHITGSLHQTLVVYGSILKTSGHSHYWITASDSCVWINSEDKWTFTLLDHCTILLVCMDQFWWQVDIHITGSLHQTLGVYGSILKTSGHSHYWITASDSCVWINSEDKWTFTLLDHCTILLVCMDQFWRQVGIHITGSLHHTLVYGSILKTCGHSHYWITAPYSWCVWINSEDKWTFTLLDHCIRRLCMDQFWRQVDIHITGSLHHTLGVYGSILKTSGHSHYWITASDSCAWINSEDKWTFTLLDHCTILLVCMDQFWRQVDIHITGSLHQTLVYGSILKTSGHSHYWITAPYSWCVWINSEDKWTFTLLDHCIRLLCMDQFWRQVDIHITGSLHHTLGVYGSILKTSGHSHYWITAPYSCVWINSEDMWTFTLLDHCTILLVCMDQFWRQVDIHITGSLHQTLVYGSILKSSGHSHYWITAPYSWCVWINSEDKWTFTLLDHCIGLLCMDQFWRQVDIHITGSLHHTLGVYGSILKTSGHSHYWITASDSCVWINSEDKWTFTLLDHCTILLVCMDQFWRQVDIHITGSLHQTLVYGSILKTSGHSHYWITAPYSWCVWINSEDKWAFTLLDHCTILLCMDQFWRHVDIHITGSLHHTLGVYGLILKTSGHSHYWITASDSCVWINSEDKWTFTLLDHCTILLCMDQFWRQVDIHITGSLHHTLGVYGSILKTSGHSHYWITAPYSWCVWINSEDKWTFTLLDHCIRLLVCMDQFWRQVDIHITGSLHQTLVYGSILKTSGHSHYWITASDSWCVWINSEDKWTFTLLDHCIRLLLCVDQFLRITHAHNTRNPRYSRFVSQQHTACIQGFSVEMRVSVSFVKLEMQSTDDSERNPQ